MVGGWRLVAAGGWRQLAVGGWWQLAVGGGWWLAVDVPLGRSLRVVDNRKKKSRSQRTALQKSAHACVLCTCKCLCPIPPLLRKHSRSPKSPGKTAVHAHPTPCLDKSVLACDTHDSKAWYATAMPRIAMLAVAENHIKTNSMGLQCVVQCRYEQNAQSQT